MVHFPNEQSSLDEQQWNAIVEVTQNPAVSGAMGPFLSLHHGLASTERAGVLSRGGAVNQQLQNEGSQAHNEAVMLAQCVALNRDDGGLTNGRGLHAMPREQHGQDQPEGGVGAYQVVGMRSSPRTVSQVNNGSKCCQIKLFRGSCHQDDSMNRLMTCMELSGWRRHLIDDRYDGRLCACL
jgi:Trp operon repressor